MKCKKGFKQKGNKCVKKSSPKSYSKKKKFNNPFKMWGSWVGAYILGFIVILIGELSSNLDKGIAFNHAFLWFINSASFGTSLIFIIGGLLIGYGIHSLIIKFKK